MHKHTSRRSSKPVSSDFPTPSASSLTQTWWRWLVITPHSPAPPHTSLGLGIVYCKLKIRFLCVILWYSFPRHLFKRTRKNKYWPRSGPFHSHLHFLTSPPLFRPVCSNSKKCHVFFGLPVAHFTALSHRLHNNCASIHAWPWCTCEQTSDCGTSVSDREPCHRVPATMHRSWN